MTSERRWVEWVLLGVDRQNTRFFIDADVSPFVRDLVFRNAFSPCSYSWHSRSEIGKTSLVRAWIDSSSRVGPDTESFRDLLNPLVHPAPAFDFIFTHRGAGTRACRVETRLDT
jgi:hypothetical protein